MRTRCHLGPLAGGAVAVMLVVAAVGCGGGGAARPTTGKGIYEANCATCHGVDGQGGVGPELAGVVAGKYPNIEDQIAIVTNGKGAMPSFKSKLTPAQIQAVAKYVSSVAGK